MLRFAVVEALASLAARVNRQQQIRESAYLWANRLAASARRSDESLSKMLSLLETDPFAQESYFATCLAEQLQDEETALVPVRQWIESQSRSFSRRPGPSGTSAGGGRVVVDRQCV